MWVRSHNSRAGINLRNVLPRWTHGQSRTFVGQTGCEGKMSDEQLIKFGQAARHMCSPEANIGKPPRREFVV